MGNIVAMRLKGFAQLRNALTSATTQQRNQWKAILGGMAEILRGDLADYPPSTLANQPRGWNTVYSVHTQKPINRWYERGYGTRWVVKSGDVRGKATSETLGRSWVAYIRETGTRGGSKGGYVAMLGTKATYSPYVHDEEQQAEVHKRNNWPTVQGVLQSRQRDLDQFLTQMVRRMYGSLLT